MAAMSNGSASPRIQGLDKRALLAAIRERLERDLDGLQAAAASSYQAAIGEESKAENEYDTRGLEASYIATAQSKRAAQIASLLSLYKTVEPRAFGPDDAVDATALVELESDASGRRTVVFLIPQGSGLSVELAGLTVQAIGPESPLGEALIGLRVGDEATVETGRGQQIYEVAGIA